MTVLELVSETMSAQQWLELTFHYQASCKKQREEYTRALAASAMVDG